MDAIEKEARAYAARMMNLTNDGERLPDELWKQAVPFVLGLTTPDAPPSTCGYCGGDGYTLKGYPPTWDSPHGDCEEVDCQHCGGSGYAEDDCYP